jgi:hypothetical protein
MRCYVCFKIDINPEAQNVLIIAPCETDLQNCNAIFF